MTDSLDFTLLNQGRGLPPAFPPIPNNTVLGNITGGVAPPAALNQAQLTALVNQFTATLAGDVPPSGGGTTNFLRADGTWAAPIALTSIVVRAFNSPGTFTYTPTTINARIFMVECWGGGGSGGVATSGQVGAAGGGGSGGYTRAWLTAAQLGASQPFTVGAGGDASVSGPGGVTTFGSPILVQANGGLAGDNFNGTLLLGRGGGPASNGTLGAGIPGAREPGIPGGNGITTATVRWGGIGAGIGAARSVVGAGVTVGGTPISGEVGAGGGGSITDGSSSPGGGNGGAGLVQVTEFIYT